MSKVQNLKIAQKSNLGTTTMNNKFYEDNVSMGTQGISSKAITTDQRSQMMDKAKSIKIGTGKVSKLRHQSKIAQNEQLQER